MNERTGTAERYFFSWLFDAPFPAVFFSGSDFIIERANDKCLKFLKRDETIVGKPVLDVLPEIEHQPAFAKLKNAYHSATASEDKEEFLSLRTNGVDIKRYVNLYYKPIVDERENVLGVLVTGYDITDQVLSRQRLQESEERTRLATEVAGLGTFDKDFRTGRIHSSLRFARIFGYSEPVSNDDYLSRVHPEDRPTRDAAHAKALKTGKLAYEPRIILDNGEVRRLRVKGTVFVDETGSPVRLIKTALDITDEQASVKKLEESEARFRTLISETPEVGAGLYIGRELRIQYVNEVMLRFWGKDKSVIGKTWREALPELVGQPFLDQLDKVFTTGIPFTGKGVKALLEINGQLRPAYYNYTYKPLRNAQGEIYAIHHMAVDVSDEVKALQDSRRMEMNLEGLVKERTLELQRSNDDLQQFAHVASHDLKEPVRKIRTFSYKLQDEFRDILGDRGNAFINKILNATDRMYSMINGVLNYASTTSVSSAHDLINLNHVIRNIETDLEILIEEKQASITCEDLPAIRGIPELIHQLFYNLINNSLKFSRENIPSRIKLSSRSVRINDVPFEEIVIADNGIGFDKQYADQIFSTFVRLHSKDKYEGSGLGLALCKKIVERHSGFISAESEPDNGATFKILLPK